MKTLLFCNFSLSLNVSSTSESLFLYFPCGDCFFFFFSFFFAAELILISSSSLDADGAALAEARLRGRAGRKKAPGDGGGHGQQREPYELPRAPIELLALEKKLRLSAHTASYVVDVQYVFFRANFG